MARGEFVPIDPERFLQAIARAARQLREERHLRLAECKDCCKVGLQTLRDWEKGKYTPSLCNLIKLANGLQVDFVEFLQLALRLYGEQG